MSDELGTPTTSSTPAADEYYTDKKKKVKDFWIGFLGSLIGNGLMGAIYAILMNFSAWQPQVDSPSSQWVVFASGFFALLPFVFTLAVIVYALVKHRRWIAFGVLGSIGAVFALSILAGIVLTIWCFISYGNL